MTEELILSRLNSDSTTATTTISASGHVDSDGLLGSGQHVHESDLLRCPSAGPQRSQTLADVQFTLNTLFGTIVVVIGVVSNVLAIIVLRHKHMRTTTNLYLTALSVWDVVVLLSTLLIICLQEMPGLSAEYQPIFLTIAPYVYPIGLTAQTATIWLTVSLTIERYIAVVHALKAARWCTMTRARLAIVSVSFLSVVFNVSRWYEYRTVYCHDDANRTHPMIERTSLGDDTTYHTIYFLGLYMVFMCALPFASLVVLNSFLFRAIYRSSEQRRQLNTREAQERNVTIMLVSVVVVFIICQTPALVYNVAYAVLGAQKIQTDNWEILSTFRNFLVTLNCGVNFIVYCMFGHKFRTMFIVLFCPCYIRRALQAATNESKRISIMRKYPHSGHVAREEKILARDRLSIRPPSRYQSRNKTSRLGQATDTKDTPGEFLIYRSASTPPRQMQSSPTNTKVKASLKRASTTRQQAERKLLPVIVITKTDDSQSDEI